MTRKIAFYGLAIMVSSGVLCVSSYFLGVPFKFSSEGELLDEFNGVEVYYNGHFNHVAGRSVSESGYNIGLKWQCVEFVKRYYLEIYSHEMPNSYGNAIDFYDTSIKDGEMNNERGLIQYSNPSSDFPEIGDIIVLSGKFGHVAIVCQIENDQVEIIQQNAGFQSREILKIKKEGSQYKFSNNRVLGRLRKHIDK